MNQLRVLVLGDRSVLGSGVREVLSHEADMEVVRLVHDDAVPLLEQIRRDRADVVVLDEIAHETDCAKILSTLERSPGLRIVLISTDSNCLKVYERRQITVRDTGDLVDAVRGVDGWP